MNSTVSGAQAMVNCLEAEGIPVIFGYPGAAICPFYDALAGSSVRHILTRNEQNAGHAASGWARMSGKPGVCVSTSGPGATNLFTAIATAYMDSIPLVVITGQVATHLLGRDVFQEVDTTGAVEPFTKYSYLVRNAAEIPRVFREAFHIASTGRKGPVLIDMPVDIQCAPLEFHYPETVEIRGYKPRYKGHAMQVRRVAEAISAAKRPLVCAGGGVCAAGAPEALRRFSEDCGIPVVSTLMGIGAMPSAHPLYFGMLGQSGVPLANRAVEESDLLILIGARVGDRAVAKPRALEAETTVVHIDIDAAEIGKNLGTAIPLVGDAAAVLGQLLEQAPRGDWAAWRAWLEENRKPAAPVPLQTNGYAAPRAFLRLLSERMEDSGVYVSDVGENQLWSARSFQARGDGRFLTTGGMGTMGYALPAAIGAKLAAPGRQVVAVCGDGAFQMSMMELATAVQHGIPVKLVVLRNGCLGLVREIQQNQYGGREFAVGLDGSPSVGGIAAAYGIPFRLVDGSTDIPAAIEEFLGAQGPFVLECAVDPQEGTE